MKVLHIDTSILGGGSVSRELSGLVTKRLLASNPGAQVIYRDLAAEDLAHVTPVTIPSVHPLSGAAGQLDDAGKAQRELSDTILKEFLDADTIVIGAPMYNFSIPSQLKAWIDRIVIPGATFAYGANGPEGKMSGKRVIVAIARGGFYGPQTARASAEHAESYIRVVLGFIGITDIEFVLAEGLAAGEHNKSNAVASAKAAIEQLVA